MGIVGGGKEDGSVVAELATAASDKLEKQQSADAVEPGQRFLVGAVNFIVATVRAGFPADFRRANRGHV